MFNKILIANRGEIACRIIKTARVMGIRTIAIFSTVDEHSRHVYEADEAFWVGESKAQESYLNIDSMIKVALKSGAEAIHPGYGFLSENPQFARACQEAGIVFIGPSINAMEAMASKQLAKQLLEKTQVPLTPGYHGKNQDLSSLQQEAQKIGYPVLLKAANGGGGKGMRTVLAESDFANALSGARREAIASFGDDTMIIEKLVTQPRHVEVQILADNHGQVLHLFERDCSIQRRHQKIIEEAPAPNLPDRLRQEIFQAACKVASSIDYRGAGTVEFLVEDDHHFYFMEMNTRLQVEHPVTEMITGLDLVAWQIKIAANEHLPDQTTIQQKGHAIECRIYAEDPEQNFIPSIGQIHFLQEPVDEGIRIDSGIQCNSQISKYYDPMIAKLIAWGDTRENALGKLLHALSHYHIGGVKTNLAFLQAICGNDRFKKAALSTHFLNEESLDLARPNPRIALFMAIAFDYWTICHTMTDPLLKHCFAWQTHLQSHWYSDYLIHSELFSVKITPIDVDSLQMECDGKILTLKPQVRNNCIYLQQDQQISSAPFENTKDTICFYFPQGPLIVERYRGDHFAEKASGHKGQLTAPMSATIVAILKKTGDLVKEGESLMVLEAMKMEHTIHAPKDGILAELFYEVGSQVNEGAELLALKD